MVATRKLLWNSCLCGIHILNIVVRGHVKLRMALSSA